MIEYKCKCGTTFQLQDDKTDGEVHCPTCGSEGVAQVPHAPAVRRNGALVIASVALCISMTTTILFLASPYGRDYTTTETESTDFSHRTYSYLPDDLNKDRRISHAEWRFLNLKASENSEKTLTEKLMQTSYFALMSHDHIWVSVNTTTPPGWMHYAGKGRFNIGDREVRAAYAEAVPGILSSIYIAFPSKPEVRIMFSAYGTPIDDWADGKMKLKGE